MRKDVPYYWKNKFIELFEKHAGLTEKMVQLMSSLGKKPKPFKKALVSVVGNNHGPYFSFAFQAGFLVFGKIRAIEKNKVSNREMDSI